MYDSNIFYEIEISKSTNLLFETMQTYFCCNRFDIADTPEFFITVFRRPANIARAFELYGVDMTAYCIYQMARKFYLEEYESQEKPELGPILELAIKKNSLRLNDADLKNV